MNGAAVSHHGGIVKCRYAAIYPLKDYMQPVVGANIQMDRENIQPTTVQRHRKNIAGDFDMNVNGSIDINY